MKKGINAAKAITDINESYIIEAMPENKISVKTFPWKYIAIASSLALVICLGLMAVLFGSSFIESKNSASSIDDSKAAEESHWEKKIVKYSDDSTPDIAREKSWEEKSFGEKFFTIGSNFTYTGAQVPKEKVDFSPYYGVLNPYGEARTTDLASGRSYVEPIIIYAIKGININWAEAVKFINEDKEIYYAYVRTDNVPGDLGTMAEMLDLENNISFGSAYYEMNDGKTVEFEKIDKKKVWDILFSDSKKSAAVSDPDEFLAKNGFKKRISISTGIEILGYRNISISLSDDGYMFTNILSTAKIFNIGKDKVQKIKSYLTSSCKGYELVYEKATKTCSSSQSDSKKSDSSSSVMHSTIKPSEKFNMFTKDGIAYKSNGNTVDASLTDNTGKNHYAYTQQHFNLYFGNEEVLNARKTNDNSIMIRISRIIGIDEKCAYAVQFPSQSANGEKASDSSWYVYVCMDFETDNLYDYALSFGLQKYAGYRYIKSNTGNDTEISVLDSSNVWNMLFADSSKSYSADKYKFSGKFTNNNKNTELVVFVRPISDKESRISISDDGYLYTDLIGQPKIFNIGKEKAKQIKDYLEQETD